MSLIRPVWRPWTRASAYPSCVPLSSRSVSDTAMEPATPSLSRSNDASRIENIALLLGTERLQPVVGHRLQGLYRRDRILAADIGANPRGDKALLDRDGGDIQLDRRQIVVAQRLEDGLRLSTARSEDKRQYQR